MQKISTAEEFDLIARAREGDERAYEELIECHRAELHAHCYRMLASAHDADDAVQEALIRAWRGLAGFESRSSVRTWLFKIATNASFDLLKKRSRRDLPIDRGRPARAGESPGDAQLDASWIEPYPDRLVEPGERSPHARYEARESLELAFIAVIQNVPTRQRAVLILREVLGYSAQETAELLETSVAAVNSSLQRARSAIGDRLPTTSQSEELSRLGDDAVQELARRYSEAIDHADVPGIVALLTDDATWSMPPHPAYYQGRRAIERFHEDDVSSVRWRHRTTSANGQLAVGCYIFDEERGSYVGSVLDVLTLRDGLIEQVTAFFSAEGLGRSKDRDGYVDAVDFAEFGLPIEIVE
ncbi:MAG: sigma-70 family RNA polymerase sigma factor [Acidimicrobiales bacterium]